MKRVISLLLAVALLCAMVPAVTVRAEAALSYTDLLLDINWTNIDCVGRQTPNSDSCSCFALAYSRTILDNTVHYFYEYNEYGNTEYSVNALWYVGQHNSAVYSSSNEVFKKLYSDLCNGKPVIVYVTGRGSSGHYITVVGFQNISSLDNLSEYNFLIIDPVFNDGHVAVNMGGVGYSLNSYRQVVYDQSSARVTFSAANNLACNHNYTSADTPASCTQDGLREYTCSSCGDTYSEPIGALGHNYVGVKTDATCDTAGYTTYTCSRCSDSYVEPADGWSEWSTEYPTAVPENLIQQKTQYSILEKEHTTSASNTLDGWTSCGTTYSDWGTVQTTTTKPTESDTLQITSTVQTGWGYYHWCNNYNDSGSWGVDSIDCAGASYYHSYVSGTALPQIAFADQGGQAAYGGTGSGAAACAYNFYVWFRNTGADVYTYSYQTRSEVNQFYKWSDEWSDWSDEEVAGNEDCQVKTQTVYRYYIGELADHNYNYAVTKEPTATATGVLTGTCMGCSNTTTETLPKLNTIDYTYSQVKAPSYTETGTGRYTWKVTTYGNFSFDVTLEKLVNANAPQIVLESKKVTKGKEFTVIVEVKNNPGFSYLEVTPVIPAALTLVKVENGELVSDFTKGKQYVWVADEDVTDDGLLLTFTFTADDSVEPGNYQVSFNVRTCGNYDEESVTLGVVAANIEVIDYIYGDATEDGVVDGFDVIRLKKYLANYDYDTESSTTDASQGADANGDGKIDGFDVIRLKKYLANYDYETGESTVILGPQ